MLQFLSKVPTMESLEFDRTVNKLSVHIFNVF